MILIRLLARRHRAFVTAWVIAILALSGLTLDAYQSTYASAQAKLAAVVLAQNNAVSTMLYGTLPSPGTPAQMFTWEIGTFVTLLVSILAVLLAVRLTRAAEDDGTQEVIRGTGVGAQALLKAAVSLLIAVAITLSAGCTLAVASSIGSIDGVTMRGAVAFGAVVAATFLVVALTTVVLAQIVPFASGVRMGGFGLLAVAFVARAGGDTQDWAAVARLSPLDLRASVAPFTHDRPVPLLVAAIVCLALIATAHGLGARREMGGGFVPVRTRLDRRLRTGSLFVFAARLARGRALAWAVATAVTAAALTAMGSGVITSTRDGNVTGGFLGAQLLDADPATAYLSYIGTLVGIMLSIQGVLAVLGVLADERSGVTVNVRATGSRRSSPLGVQVALSAPGSLLVLVLVGAAMAAVAVRAISGPHVGEQAFVHMVGQWPAVMAVVGLTALLVGAAPRLSSAGWVFLGASALVSLLGSVLNAPPWLVRLSAYGHAPDATSIGAATGATACLLAVAGAAIVAGLAGASRRDVVSR